MPLMTQAQFPQPASLTQATRGIGSAIAGMRQRRDEEEKRKMMRDLYETGDRQTIMEGLARLYGPQMAMKQQEVWTRQDAAKGAAGRTQKPAAQWMDIKVPDGKGGHRIIKARGSRDAEGNAVIEPGTFQGRIAEAAPDLEWTENEVGEVMVFDPLNKKSEPVVDARTDKPIKDPKVLDMQNKTRLGWANYDIAKNREGRKLSEWQGKISPKEKKQTGRMRVSQTLVGLTGFYDNLNNMGGLVNVDEDVYNNLWASVKSSWLGQTVGKVTGTKEQTTREMVHSTRPLLVQYIRQASEMGARGMDSQQELNFYLQAATDPAKMSYQSNLNAIKMLNQAYGLNAPQGKPKFDVNAALNKFSGTAPVQPKPQRKGITKTYQGKKYFLPEGKANIKENWEVIE